MTKHQRSQLKSNGSVEPGVELWWVSKLKQMNDMQNFNWSLQRSKEVLSDINATGIAMLFSGGTFLYVATVHILPELARFGVQTQTALPDTVISVHEHRGFSKTELVVMVIGCILPLVLALGHRHQIEVESLRISAFSWHSVAGRLDENDLVIIRQKSQLRNLNNIAYNLLWFRKPRNM